MSGGHFSYKQYHITDIYRTIEDELNNQGKEKEDLNSYPMGYFDKYPHEKFNQIHSEEIQKIMKDAIEILKKAEEYIDKIDGYLSGDIGEDFLIKNFKTKL